MTRLVVILLALGLVCAFAGTSQAVLLSTDIGAAEAGSGWMETGGVHTITGGGSDIWGTSDNFRFVHEEYVGDVTITARLVDQTRNGNDWAKSGVMVRDSLDANSQHVHVAERPGVDDTTLGDGVFMQYRAATGGGSATSFIPGSPMPRGTRRSPRSLPPCSTRLG